MTDKAEEEKLACPSCGKPLTEDEGGWHCECGFRAYRTMRGTEITPDELMKIFAGQGSELSFTSKAGHPYKQKLKLSDDKKKLLFDITARTPGSTAQSAASRFLSTRRNSAARTMTSGAGRIPGDT